MKALGTSHVPDDRRPCVNSDPRDPQIYPQRILFLTKRLAVAVPFYSAPYRAFRMIRLLARRPEKHGHAIPDQSVNRAVMAERALQHSAKILLQY